MAVIASPALFVQEMTYAVWLLMVSELEPDTAPEASAGIVCHSTPFLVMVQEFTLVAFHDIVVESPCDTLLEEEFIEAVGAGIGVGVGVGVNLHAPPVQLRTV